LDLGDIDHLFYHKALKKAKEVEARDYVENPKIWMVLN
jgi:hypothetical protein